MKTTSYDAVGLTTDLYACVIEWKETRPLREAIEQLAIYAVATVAAASVSDEQILSLP